MRIPFEAAHRQEYQELLAEVFDSGFLSEGKQLAAFEAEFSEFVGLHVAGVSNGGAALSALYEYVGLDGADVIVPANTFWATTVLVKRAGGNVIYADSRRDDLCLSLDDIKRKLTPATKAVVITHIGGHLAFEIAEIQSFCRDRGLYLIEDCAHAHGASWNNKTAGSWGVGGAYSFYSTKTMPIGEGGMVVSADSDFIDWVKQYRNYGKQVVGGQVSYPIANGVNCRMNEVTAAFGRIQLRRLPDILAWKRDLAGKFDEIFERRVQLPDGMVSGYYKYVVFDYELTQQTGKVFNHTDFGNEINGGVADVPNAYWIAEHHKCAPIWYGWDNARLSVAEIRHILLGS